MPAERRTIVVSPSARELRRRLGPTAWVVLEELLSASHGDADDCQSTATVRSLAADLGLSKDTVARVLTRLSAAGIVDRRARPRSRRHIRHWSLPHLRSRRDRARPARTANPYRDPTPRSSLDRLAARAHPGLTTRSNLCQK